MEKLVYDVNRKILYDKGNVFRPKRAITETQGKVFELLMDNEKHSYEEIMEFVYNIKVEEATESDKIRIRTLVSRLRKRIKTYKNIEILRNNEDKKRYGSFQMKGAVWLE